MTPVYVYTRFSSNMQKEDSHEYQLEQCQHYCDMKGYQIVHHYKDSAMSATTVERKDLQNMVKDVKHSGVKVIVVFKLERIFRDVFSGISVMRELEDYGCHIESTCESIDDTVDGIFITQLELALSERYVNQLKFYTKTACINQAKTGKYLGGKPPFGFILSEDRKLIKDPANYRTVEKIFTMVAEGASYKEIAEWLNVHEMYNANQKPWNSKSDFHSIIKNKKYCGYYVYNRTESRRHKKKNHRKSKPKEEIIEIKGGVEAIVSEELWQQCNEILTSRVRCQGHGKHFYKLSGVLKCGICGGNLSGCNHGNMNGRRKPWRTYRCNNASKLSKEKRCRCKEINCEYLDKLATQCLCRYLSSEDNIKKIVEAVNVSIEEASINDRKIERLGTQLNECKEGIDNLVSVMEKGNTSEVILNRLNELEKEKAELERELEKAKAVKDEFKPVSYQQIKSLFDESLNVLKVSDTKEVKRLLRLFYKEIVVDNDTITLKISMDSFFNGDFESPIETLEFDREHVLKCKGTLSRLNYRMKKAVFLQTHEMSMQVSG